MVHIYIYLLFTCAYIYIYIQIICIWKGLSILCVISSKYCRRYTVASFSWFWLPSHLRVQESKSFWMMNLSDFHHIGSDGANRGEYSTTRIQSTSFKRLVPWPWTILGTTVFHYHHFLFVITNFQMFSFSGQAGAVFEVGILDDFLRRRRHGKRQTKNHHFWPQLE